MVDLSYVQVESPDMADLYKVRAVIFSFQWKKMFMEDIASEIFAGIEKIPISVSRLKMTLLFGKHIIELKKR